MDAITAIAASGLRSRMESLEMLANNVANASTGGYKADREFYSLYTSSEAGEFGTSASMPVIERPWIDYSPGVVHPTGNPLDVALSGKGFFSVNGPAGPLYTRNGNFRLSADGRLVTADGYPVRSSSGAPVALDGSKVVEIAADGSIRQDGTLMGRLEIADFTSMGSLRKQGSNYFRADETSVKPVAPSGTLVEQGKLEASNTGSAEAAVRLVSVMRQFEMLQKAVNLGTEMDRRAVEEVAKV